MYGKDKGFVEGEYGQINISAEINGGGGSCSPGNGEEERSSGTEMFAGLLPFPYSTNLFLILFPNFWKSKRYMILIYFGLQYVSGLIALVWIWSRSRECHS